MTRRQALIILGVFGAIAQTAAKANAEYDEALRRFIDEPPKLETDLAKIDPDGIAYADDTVVASFTNQFHLNLNDFSIELSFGGKSITVTGEQIWDAIMGEK